MVLLGHGSRAKDLIDLVPVGELTRFEFTRLREVVVTVFGARATHELPASVPAPPCDWAHPYRALAAEVGLHPDPAVGYGLVVMFLDPVLAAEPGLTGTRKRAGGGRAERF